VGQTVTDRNGARIAAVAPAFQMSRGKSASVMTSFFFLLLVMTAVSACSRSSPEPNPVEVDQLKRFLEVSPEDRLAAARERSVRPPFLGVYGFSMSIPGLEEDQVTEYVKGNVSMIPGTSDASFSDEHSRLQPLAIDYAARYNRRLLAMLRERSP
jgi:hypothetical protein